MIRYLRRLSRALIVSFVALAAARAVSVAQAETRATPPIRHVFLIVLSDRPRGVGFGDGAGTPYLASTLPRQGVMLENYYAIGHWALDDYVALISGQGPNIATQRGCMDVSEFQFHKPNLDAHGQALGYGCIYPSLVQTLPDQLEKAGLTWKGYMDDYDSSSQRDQAMTCSTAKIGQKDLTRIPTTGGADSYVASQNPFVYFHGVIDSPSRCNSHIVSLTRLKADLSSTATTPNYTFIVPSLCHESWDTYCDTKQLPPGQIIASFLRKWVPLIESSPAFRQDGLLIITFAQTDGASPGDYQACCAEMGMADDQAKPGYRGPGGGRVGAVALSPFIRPGTVSKVPYNHYSLLRTVEDVFGLSHLGFAAEPKLQAFGRDVFNDQVSP